MGFVMRPEMVYDYPIWSVAALIAALGIVFAVAVELCARRLLPVEFRRRHNDVAAAMLSIIGVTYAVLLAFVAMLAWDGFNHAKAASFTEAAFVHDIAGIAGGFAEPTRSAIRNDIADYARTVVNVEWPAQAEGKHSDRGGAYLDAINRIAIGFHPATMAESNLHAQLLQSLSQLEEARQSRVMAAESAIPEIVWVVLLAGGALTIAFVSFLGAPSLVMQIAMSSTLAISGALVLIMIVALSNPFRGDFRITAAPYRNVLAQDVSNDDPPATK